MTDRAVVIGAGIAGLATAHVLEDLGYDVRVIERDAGLRLEGGGLSLWPNALQALSSLGLEKAVSAHIRPLREGATLMPNGRVLSKWPLPHIERRFGQLVSIHRAELLLALRESFSGNIEFATPATVKDGRLWAGGAAIEAELIVGADGISSVARAVIAPEVDLRLAGYGAWRGVAEIGAMTPTGISETLGRGKRFGLIPLPNNHTHWYAVIGEHADLASEFAGWHQPIGEVLEATPTEDRSFLPLMDLPRLPRWHHEQTVLVGDAAHAMTPNMGQGAAQAIVDVAALARHLKSAPLPLAFAGYVKERKRHTERIVALSRASGQLGQASSLVTTTARNMMIRSSPDAWLLSWACKTNIPARDYAAPHEGPDHPRQPPAAMERGGV